jgi:hypothetical protein
MFATYAQSPVVLVTHPLIEVDPPAEAIVKRTSQLLKSKFTTPAAVTDASPPTSIQVTAASGDIWSFTVQLSNVPSTTICPTPPGQSSVEDDPLTAVVKT